MLTLFMVCLNTPESLFLKAVRLSFFFLDKKMILEFSSHLQTPPVYAARVAYSQLDVVQLGHERDFYENLTVKCSFGLYN